MIFIGGISQGQKILDYVKTVICSQCGAYGRYQVFMTYTCFSFFFIPIFKWNRRYFVKMSCCETLYQLDQAAGEAIRRGENLDIPSSALTLVRAGHVRSSWDNGACKTWHRCSSCGYETEEDFAFCPRCGSRL